MYIQVHTEVVERWKVPLLLSHLKISPVSPQTPLLGPSPLIIPPPAPQANIPRSFTMEGQNENDELYPIAVLIDELKVRSEINLMPSPPFGRPLVEGHGHWKVYWSKLAHFFL